MKKVEHSEPIDFTGWTFFGDERLDPVVAEVCAEAVRATLDEDGGDPYLPWSHERGDGIGGAHPDDPLTIYIRLPFGATDDHPTFSFSLNDCIDEMIEFRNGEEFPANIIAIRDALRAAAQRIDDAVKVNGG